MRRWKPPTHLAEHDDWIRRLLTIYPMPRAELVRQLSRPGALEIEIGRLIARRCQEHAELLYIAEQPAPQGDDPYERTVRALLQRLLDQREAALQEEQREQNRQADETMRRWREEQEQERAARAAAQEEPRDV